MKWGQSWNQNPRFLVIHPGLIPEYAFYLWMESAWRKQMHLTSCDLHVMLPHTQNTAMAQVPNVRLWEGGYPQRGPTSQLWLASVCGVSVGPFTGTMPPVTVTEPRFRISDFLPASATHLGGTLVESLPLSWPHFSQSQSGTKPHQRCGDHCNWRVKCATWAMAARSALLRLAGSMSKICLVPEWRLVAQCPLLPHWIT